MTITQKNNVPKLGSKKLGCAGNLDEFRFKNGILNGTLVLLQAVILKALYIVTLKNLTYRKKNLLHLYLKY